MSAARMAVPLAAIALSLACTTPRRNAVASPSIEEFFPPRWQVGDSWVVSMTTEVRAPADLGPQFVERAFRYEVTRMPTERQPTYRVEVRPEDADEDSRFALYFRVEDFSLARVARAGEGGIEDTVISNGPHPFVNYAHRLPIIADAPIAHPRQLMDEPYAFNVGGKTVVQRVRIEADTLHLRLEQQDPGVMLIVEVKWRAGDPWWREIVCLTVGSSNRDLPRKNQIAASGFMLSKSPAPR